MLEKAFNPKKMVGRIKSVMSAFLPEEAVEVLNMLNDPKEIEPMLNKGFVSLFKGMDISPQHMRIGMGYNADTELMQYYISVYNRYTQEWHDIPFPAAEFLSCLFMDSERDLVIEGVRKMILIWYNYDPNSGKIFLNGKSQTFLELGIGDGDNRTMGQILNEEDR